MGEGQTQGINSLLEKDSAAGKSNKMAEPADQGFGHTWKLHVQAGRWLANMVARGEQ